MMTQCGIVEPQGNQRGRHSNKWHDDTQSNAKKEDRYARGYM